MAIIGGRTMTSARMHHFPSLPARESRLIFEQLLAALPPPDDDSPEAREQRDTLAVAVLAALKPANLAEAQLAIEVVVSDAHAKDYLRLASANHHDIDKVLGYRAQALKWMGRMNKAMARLNRAKATRPPAPKVRLPLVEARRIAHEPAWRQRMPGTAAVAWMRMTPVEARRAESATGPLVRLAPAQTEADPATEAVARPRKPPLQ